MSREEFAFRLRRMCEYLAVMNVALTAHSFIDDVLATLRRLGDSRRRLGCDVRFLSLRNRSSSAVAERSRARVSL